MSAAIGSLINPNARSTNQIHPCIDPMLLRRSENDRTRRWVQSQAQRA